ncbi:Serine/threonine-protein phosphatase 4 regulatory subunit 3 [Babesia microti strain RI]|uniref:Serine/threonine-protein phosphatase 4 regulatory subunit 3 n=1 Tax=Babesia microti (strain RI) TaxID=1133968 RepID=A0A1N6LXH0_BABMR|nr:Serine/threonine-protein phosphatase 4 regulatory subunit 3 [Babesia microti strain RI]SIO73563.1 Serine/threonine-protein phosphatase 4 regulatory subunit 3 [Babesia microti strain RI]|eukprot:XP_021337651.1 Serine/threonine-protein phosphatase 4 regulatory subunit 3 [Babesia microti strain RI]
MFTMVPESEGVEHEESGNEYQIQNGNSYNLNYENFNLNCTNLDGEHSVNDLPSTLLRVKLYEVDIQSSKWIDKGTGRCRVEESFIGESPKLIVKSEDDPNVFIANTYIKDNTDYACQNDSIITWQDGANPELVRALSFQNPIGHHAIWNYINMVITGKRTYSNQKQSTTDSDTTYKGDDDNIELDAFRVLPIINAYSIDRLEHEIDAALADNENSEEIYIDIIDKAWLKMLFNFMNNCIYNKKYQIVSKIAYILRRILLNWCGNLELMQIIVSDEMFFDFLRAFEYDRELIGQGIVLNHVKFFKCARFIDIVNVPNPNFIKCISNAYRLSYIKDVILPRHLDEFSIQRMNNVIFNNMSDILTLIVNQGRHFFQELKNKLLKNYHVGLFLKELLICARNNQQLSQPERNSLILMVRHYHILNDLISYMDGSCEACKFYEENVKPINSNSMLEYKNIKDSMAKLVGNSQICERYKHESGEEDGYRPNLLNTSCHLTPDPVTLATEIIYICTDSFPAVVRAAIFANAEKSETHEPLLMLQLCKVIVESYNDAIQSQCKDIIVRLIDSRHMDLPEKDEICTLFYDKGVLDYLLNIIYTPLECLDAYDYKRLHNAKLEAVDILSTCVKEHKHRFKLRIQSQKIPLKVVVAMSKPYDKFLALGVIKFIKSCLQLKDGFVEKHICQHNILRIVIWILRNLKGNIKGSDYSDTFKRGNLVESACLDLLNFIENNSIECLIIWLFEDRKCKLWLQGIKDYYPIVKILEKKYEFTVNNSKRPLVLSKDVDDSWFEEEEDLDDTYDVMECDALPDYTISNHSTEFSAYNSSSLVEGYDDEDDIFPTKQTASMEDEFIKSPIKLSQDKVPVKRINIVLDTSH